MSYTTITRSFGDPELRDRVNAAIAKEAYANAALGATLIGQRVQHLGPQAVLDRFMWPIAIDNEAAYAFAVEREPPNPNPGRDASVITDANLASGVQVHWPAN